MNISEIGEFGLIQLISDAVARSREPGDIAWDRVVLGIGDDAAAWRGDDSIQLATTDTLVQDVHFSLDNITWSELGWKALAVSLSDIAAMGGIPRYALLSLALPQGIDSDCILALIEGMLQLTQRFHVAIVGGNTVSAPEVSVTTTVLGSTEKKDSPLLTRSDARPGEQIAVTGYLGSSAGGLKMLRYRLQFDEKTARLLREAHMRPFPRVDEGRLLSRLGIRAAIDISDGLLSDLSHVCQASGTGARIRVDWLPVNPLLQAAFPGEATGLALSGGEDYELLFTGGKDAIARVKEEASCPITVIGQMVKEPPGEVTIKDEKGKIFHWDRAGWDHFVSTAARAHQP